MFAVAQNVSGVVTTSSPGPMPHAMSDRCRAAEQELTASACGAPTYAANSCSNWRTRGPVESQPEASVRCTSSNSAEPRSGGAKGTTNGAGASVTQRIVSRRSALQPERQRRGLVVWGGNGRFLRDSASCPPPMPSQVSVGRHPRPGPRPSSPASETSPAFDPSPAFITEAGLKKVRPPPITSPAIGGRYRPGRMDAARHSRRNRSHGFVFNRQQHRVGQRAGKPH
jgi:hypothetical protein